MKSFLKVRYREIISVKGFCAQMYHQPVMVDQVIEGLNCMPGKVYVDGTVGGAGHSRYIARHIQPDGTLICLDVDKDALEESCKVLNDYKNVHIIKSNYLNIPDILTNLNIQKITGGVLLDLGVSYNQITSPVKGFSFQNDSPLDMRMDKDLSVTAEDLVNDLTAPELYKIFKEYGEERYSKKIAFAISEYTDSNRIKTTKQLAEIVEKTVPKTAHTRIHPATRIFQALRIKVNNELDILKEALKHLLDIMDPGARLAIITFHSLEDRIVKQFFKHWSLDCACPVEMIECRCKHVKKLNIITKKPIVPSDEEVKNNNAARSAKLRIAERL